MSDLVECRGLRKAYSSGTRRVEVLQGLDLAIARGELVAIVGESGVGKSTLLHLLGALDHLDGGTYLFDGADVAALGTAERAVFRNRKVGFVFQFHHLLPELTVLENTLLPALIGRAPRREAEERARGILDGLGLAEMRDQIPSELSGGEQQRAAVARALMTAQDLLLADEPTGNLDPVTADRVFEAFRAAQAERGLAAVVATHSLKLAGRCDRVMRLRNGILIRETPEALLALEASRA